MKGAIDKAAELARDIPGAFIPGQFNNPANPAAHRTGTGPEIWSDTDGAVDIFVAGVGTGGTVTGVGRVPSNQKIRPLRSLPSSRTVRPSYPAAAPASMPSRAPAPVLCRMFSILKSTDEVIRVRDNDALETARELASMEGLLVGISSGAAVWAACDVAKRARKPPARPLSLVLPDTGERYLSTALFSS